MWYRDSLVCVVEVRCGQFVLLCFVSLSPFAPCLRWSRSEFLHSQLSCPQQTLGGGREGGRERGKEGGRKEGGREGGREGRNSGEGAEKGKKRGKEHSEDHVSVGVREESEGPGSS